MLTFTTLDEKCLKVKNNELYFYHMNQYQKSIQKLKARKGLLYILIFSLVTVFIWIGISIFLSQKKTKVPEKVQNYTKPLNPNIDREIVEEIEARRYFSEDELQNFFIYTKQEEKTSTPLSTPPLSTQSAEQKRETSTVSAETPQSEIQSPLQTLNNIVENTPE